MRSRVSTIAGVGVMAALTLGAAPVTAGTTGSAARQCTPARLGEARALLDRVPGVAEARMAPMRDGGVVTAFWSYRAARGFPAGRFTVIAVGAAGCLRWRASLPGPWPITQPLQVDARSIVVAAGTTSASGVGPLRIFTLSAATGRVLRTDVFAAFPQITLIAPTIVGDRRGDVAVVFASEQPIGSRGRVRPVTVKLARRAQTRRWTREVIAHANLRPPAAAAGLDGTMVVAYPQHHRFWVRVGTVAGRLGRPVDAGPVLGNLQDSKVALATNGTMAAVWETASNDGPWHVRAAVRPAGNAAFAPFADLATATRRAAGALPALHLSDDGAATVGYFEAATSTRGELVQEFGTRGVRCAQATPSGRFGGTRLVVAAGPSSDDVPAMLFGPAGRSTVVALMPEDKAVVTAASGCRVTGSVALDPSTNGWPEQAVIDTRGRTWVIGQTRRDTGARRPLLLTIVAPA